MRSRTRSLIVIVLLIAAGGAGWSSWQTSRHIAQLDKRQHDLSERIDRLLATIDAVTNAQQAHVTPSPDQDPLQVPALIEQLRTEAESVRPDVSSTEAGRALQAIAMAVTSLQDIESRASEHLRLGQDLMATDVIFTEGRAVDVAVVSGLRTLRTAEDEAFATARADALDRSWTILGSVAVFWMLGLMLLARGSEQSEPDASSVVPLTPSVPEVQATPAAPASPVRADLQAAADVCTAIGRLTSADELPRLLNQAATVLEASGIVVWMAGGEELFPAAASGYAPHVIRRLGPIHRAAINATAAAWRTSTIQVVPGHENERGALAAPLLGPDRCVGVLAVEVRAGQENDPATRAVTALFAAQLSAALAAWPAASAAAPVEAPPLERAAEA